MRQVREEFQQLIDEGFIDELMQEESRRGEGVISEANLPTPPGDLAVVMWIKRTAKEVAFWDKSHNGFAKGGFIGELRLYNRLVDRLPDLQAKVKPPSGGYHNHQTITKTLVRMVSQGYIEELEAEGKLRQNQSQQVGMFDQESVGTSDESNSSTRATRGTHIGQSSFSMREDADYYPALNDTREIAPGKDTTGTCFRNIFRSVHSKSRSDFTDTPKASDDTSASCCATIATSCSEYYSRLREIDAESIVIPDLRALPPISIPASTQHAILYTLQYNLEIAFFEFVQKYYPGFLASNGLTHAQTVTLNVWTAIFLKACSKGEISLGTRALRSITVVFEDFDELFEASIKRLILDGNRVAELTASAAYTMKYLGDRFRAGKVNEISLALVTACTEDIVNNFTRITNELQDTREKIAMGRKKLDMLEEKLKRRSDREMKELVERLEGSLRQELGALQILDRTIIN
ncbi:uncharacterized protein LAJ45_01039 [Morchella importuna]|uniref:uncharacterized protein n=1 Tax=Morchella importuna TaxID=1174673 RepID=UPI001E8EA1FF|nr:uncharacterized protein LAJ45_01039 [Morchella importuna]KAH8154511.1 hypothetical protein LAJ45_01039 [Morchella importuna]